MFQNLTGARGRSSRPEAFISRRTPLYAELSSSEESILTEEYEVLLSQFTRHSSSHKPQKSPLTPGALDNNGTPDGTGQTRGNSNFIAAQHDDGNPPPRNHTKSPQPRPKHSRPPTEPTRRTFRSTGATETHVSGIATQQADSNPSSRNHNKSPQPRRKLSRPPSESAEPTRTFRSTGATERQVSGVATRQHDSNPSSRNHTRSPQLRQQHPRPPTEPSRTFRSTVTPETLVTGRKRAGSKDSRPLHVDKSQGPSKLRSLGRGSPIRRSTRARNEPVNYYQCPNFFDDLDEGVSMNEALPTDHPLDTSHERGRTSPSRSPSQPRGEDPIGNSTGMQYELIYYSSELQVAKWYLKGPADMEDLKHARYSPQSNPVDYTTRVQNGGPSFREVPHVDFLEHEMKAILDLLQFFGCCQSVSHEMAPADQVIHLVKTSSVPTGFSKRINQINKLVSLLTRAQASDYTLWLLDAITPTTQHHRHARAQRYLTKALGLKDPNASLSDFTTTIMQLPTYFPQVSILSRRRGSDIDLFLEDAKRGSLPSVPSKIIVTDVKPSNRLQSTRASRRSATLNRVLQGRELGHRVEGKLRPQIKSRLITHRTWKGASNDVNVLAWSPDGTWFAAGATALCDEHNMDYNRRNNLLVGDLVSNCLEELPDHWISRPRTNSRILNDTPLFMTVTGMQWFEDALFTSSYDKTVKMWDFPRHRPRCLKTFIHDSKVEVMARSILRGNLLATGTHRIGLWQIDSSRYTPLEASSKKCPEMISTSLVWGTLNATKDFLLAGMSEKEDGVSQNGLLASWRIGEASATPIQFSHCSQNIFDIKWHPTIPYFATASSVGNGRAGMASRDTRSVVRLYQPLLSKNRTHEFECPALDVNDVTFCPLNPNYLTASCTDGAIYAWDIRKENQLLHKLQHGTPLNPIDETLPREEADVGVRMTVWGDDMDTLYTGASDGVVKRWNILRSPEDTLVRDEVNLQGGVMCGAFSEDKSNLLIGDSAGALHILSPGPFSADEIAMEYKGASEASSSQHEPDTESGISFAEDLLASGELVRHPTYGVGKGPHYKGPFAAWARPERTPPDQMSRVNLRKEYQVLQLEGPPLERRPGLNEQARRDHAARVQLSRMRNRRQNEGKRKHESSAIGYQDSPQDYSQDLPQDNFINLCSDEDEDIKPIKLAAKRPTTDIPELIDLTSDTDEATLSSFRTDPLHSSERPLTEVSGALEELEEKLEDDHWWPENSTVDANIP
ncbi:WD40 repeat-like protein [Aspergillus campestris IBT 28561]|uniref:WD40 repeat-like protein n=1 Tax=Aspergillus campestris (strain IBT 28561) TaxID=1392248 RepID=A0A2I1D265_ASPC2|nr:WD40 repeat-like protein [Aspergillus campestris IBT 28561]PKY03972.1 WD40 repeat-like protein [Aspergillus campestris IBT 28561]